MGRLLDTTGPWLHVLTASGSELNDAMWALDGEAVACRLLRGAKMMSESRLLDECAAALQFPCYFGDNWAALDECMADLSWLPARARVLCVTGAHMVLGEDAEGPARFFRLLERAAAEWAKPDAFRPAAAFHVVLQTEPDMAAALRSKLQQAGTTFDEIGLDQIA